MPRGRKPKPTRLKVINGNPGKRPLNENEPKPRVVVPRCPDWLSDEAKREWKRLVPKLKRLGLITELDGETLAAYCEAYSDFRRATEVLKGGTMIRTQNGSLKSHPAVTHKAIALRQMRDYGALFGLSPSDRSRLSVSSLDDEILELEAFIADAG